MKSVLFSYLIVSILVLLALFGLAGAACAEVVDVSLPELTGDYEIWPDSAPAGRTTTFMFPADVQSFEELNLVLSGTWAEGIIVCSGAWGPPDTTSFTPGLSMFLTASENFDGFFHATILPPHGKFNQWNAEFEYCCPGGPGDLSQLLGTLVSVELFCDVVLILPCNIVENSFGTLAEVRIEALGAVPVEGSSWGAVKSLFR